MNKNNLHGLFLLIIVFFCVTLLGNGVVLAQPHYMATIHPLTEILKKLTQGRAGVNRLLAPGISPHTFDPKPSDLKLLEGAAALFYVGGGLDKEWVDRLPALKKVEMLSLVPPAYRLKMVEHFHETTEQNFVDEKNGHVEHPSPTDPHFWTDPHLVREMLPGLVQILSSLDQDGRKIYEQNAAIFTEELEQLDRDLTEQLKPLSGRSFFLFHPSFQYFFKRYRLELAGVIEPFPGKEPSPKALYKIVQKIKQTGAPAVFTEPQLPRRPATVLAEAAGVEVFMVDPIGGTSGRMTYEQLLRFNADIFRKAYE